MSSTHSTFMESFVNRRGDTGPYKTPEAVVDEWLPKSELLRQVVAGKKRLVDFAQVVHSSNRGLSRHQPSAAELNAAVALQEIFPMEQEVECFHLGKVTCNMREPVEQKSLRRGFRDHWFSILFTILIGFGVFSSIVPPVDFQIYWPFALIALVGVGIWVADYRQTLVNRFVIFHRKSLAAQMLRRAEIIDKILNSYRAQKERSVDG